MTLAMVRPAVCFRTSGASRGDLAAHLAVDLEDDLEGVFFEGVGVDGGPAGVEDGARRVSTPNRLRGKTSPDSIAEQYK